MSLVRAHQAVLIYAPSGVGKSSLVEAGLRPQLEERGRCIVYPTSRVRGLRLPFTGESSGNIYVQNVLKSLGAPAPPEGSPGQTLASALGRLQSQHGGGADFMRVLVVDQLEELFTVYPERWRERQGFFEEIQKALDADDLLRVVLVLRDDYLARLKPYTSAFSDNLRTQYALERLRRDAALDAITLPIRHTRRVFSDDAAEMLVDFLLAITPDSPEGPTVLGEFVEPVELQVVSLDLWERLPPDVSTITAEHVRQFARIGEVLARFYDEAVEATVATAAVREKTLRSWTEQSLITPSGTRALVFRDATTTGGLPNRAVDVLEERRIIRSEHRAGSQWYELTHDRLISAVRNSNVRWFTDESSRLRRRWAVRAAAVFGLLLLVVAGVVTWRLLADDPVPDLMSLQERRTLTAGAADTFNARGKEGTVLFNVHELSAPEVTVQLLNRSGDVVETIRAGDPCPDGGDPCPAVERLVEIPADGPYRVRATSQTEGGFTLSSQRVVHGDELQPGQWISAPDGKSAGDMAFHRLRSEQRGIAIVQMQTGGGKDVTDPVDLEVRTLDGEHMANADRVDFSYAVLFVTLPGDYAIRPVIGDGQSYRMIVSIHTASPLQPGAATEATFTEERAAAHSVDLGQGDVALFHLTTDDPTGDPDLYAFAPGGEQLAVSEGTVPGHEVVGVRANEAGTYYLMAFSSTEGRYRVSYTRLSAAQG